MTISDFEMAYTPLHFFKKLLITKNTFLINNSFGSRYFFMDNH